MGAYWRFKGNSAVSDVVPVSFHRASRNEKFKLCVLYLLQSASPAASQFLTPRGLPPPWFISTVGSVLPSSDTYNVEQLRHPNYVHHHKELMDY